MTAKINVVETTPKSSKKIPWRWTKSDQNSKKFKGKCYNCDKSGHKSKDCKRPMNMKKPKVRVNDTEVDYTFDHVNDLNIAVIVYECNVVGNTKE